VTTRGVSSHRNKQWPRDPYKGLNYFTFDDAPLFGQREVEVDEVTSLLSSVDTSVLLLHGCTGAGKSSFLRAGLAPRLRRMSPEYGRNFFYISETEPSGDPLLIRATDDPIARIFQALKLAAAMQSVPEGAREGIRKSLADPLPQDRLKAVPIILAVLKSLTSPPQRDAFVLLIDQAEEVLTLPATEGVSNAREAFFALLEQICIRHLDVRVIVALRTEYYGRFCSAFVIRPTNKLTPATEVRAGLMDYLLRVLREHDLAAAIRWPTAGEETERDDGLPPPRTAYKFVYADNLPETIADDLVRHSGEASALPVMQIVCKQLYERVILNEMRTEITEHDYIRFGRTDGAIDSFLVRSLREAAAAAHLPPLSDNDVDIWAVVLSHVVGRTEGGTVQTLIAEEQDLLAEANKRGVSDDIAQAMLEEMVQPDRLVLRRAAGESGASAYSLGHDSLGPTLLRRSTQASARAEAEAQLAREREIRALADARAEAQLAHERETRAVAEAQAEVRLTHEREVADIRVRHQQSKSRLTLAVVAFSILALVASGAFFTTNEISPLRERVKIITNYAEHEQTSDFRLRLILLAAALRSVEAWPGSWFVDPEPSKEALRTVLARSPIFGGTYAAAAWNANGQNIVRLETDRLVVHNLMTGRDGKPSELPAGPTGAVNPPSIGFIELDDKTESLLAFRADTAKLLAGREGSPLLETAFDLPPPKPGIFIPRADILGQHFRVVFLEFNRAAIVGMEILQLSGLKDNTFKDVGNTVLSWQPFAMQALRQPILAEDCNAYAFVGRDENGYTLWLGQLGDKNVLPFHFEHIPSLTATTIARKCNAALVRDESTLHIIPLKPDQQKLSIPLGRLHDVAAMQLPTAQQVQPMFAAAPLPGNLGWRVGWPTAGGLAVVDFAPDAKARPNLLANNQLLTGLETSYVTGSLSLSPDGSRAFITQQQTFNTPIHLRAFDLDLPSRKDALSKISSSEALIREACRVAKLQGEGNRLRYAERLTWLSQHTWLSDKNLQPCTGNE
jgi:hypothetical protein